ncbi:MAG: tRNA (adenosine(37)-N6)-dimethylallyltransferase MiaA [Minisyncoccia bacterium]
MPKLKPLIVIVGPTASGKSELALKLAKQYNGEIINADSRQIYKEMDIGTNKLEIGNCSLKCKNNIQYSISNIPVHLINIRYPNQAFSLAQYKRLAIQIIRDIHERGKIPILVGGTGLYISSIVNNLEIPKAPPNHKIRNKLEKKSVKQLFNMLNKADPKSAGIIGPRNKRKIIRALEVYKITGKPFSSQQIKGKPLFDVLQIGIKIDREKLYKKIDKRVDLMIKDGLIDETKYLVKKYSNELPAMTGIGYREINQCLKGETSMEEASQLIKFRTHHYARRQMTWFKRDERINWVANYKTALKNINGFLSKPPKSKLQNPNVKSMSKSKLSI